MKRIESFEVDHSNLLEGIYESRVDYVEDHPLTTYDLRLLKPNTELLDPKAIHTIEHIVATYIRNSEIGKEVIYFGPMGCRTGFYMILSGNRTPKDIREFVIGAFLYVYNSHSIPGVSREECGSYLEHNLQEARLLAIKYVGILKDGNEKRYKYPK